MRLRQCRSNSLTSARDHAIWIDRFNKDMMRVPKTIAYRRHIGWSNSNDLRRLAANAAWIKLEADSMQAAAFEIWDTDLLRLVAGWANLDE